MTEDSSNYPTHPVHTYDWDAEGRVSQVDPGSNATWIFTYNALGQRVQWAYGNSGGADQHWFDPAGNWLGNAGEFSTVRFGDRLLSVYLGSETYLYHMNNLNSTTMATIHNGGLGDDSLFYPWGDPWENIENFAGLPYFDTKTNNDFTTFRVYSPNLGRWFSPDPLGGHLEDPQTLNKYAYVRNNPTSLTDPTGLDSYLICTPTDQNASTCQQQRVGGTDKSPQMAWVQGVTGENGFTATLIGNENGSLVDKTTGTGTYTASVNGSGVQFSNNGGLTSSTGVFVNGTPSNKIPGCRLGQCQRAFRLHVYPYKQQDGGEPDGGRLLYIFWHSRASRSCSAECWLYLLPGRR